MSEDRYQLRFGDGPWREVSKAEWVAAERGAGFHGGRPGEPSTGGFGTSLGVRGRIEHGPGPGPDPAPAPDGYVWLGVMRPSTEKGRTDRLAGQAAVKHLDGGRWEVITMPDRNTFHTSAVISTDDAVVMARAILDAAGVPHA